MWKTHLSADRMSCCRAIANKVRLFLHVGAYWLTWSLGTPMPRHSNWQAAHFDTIRLIPTVLRSDRFCHCEERSDAATQGGEDRAGGSGLPRRKRLAMTAW